MASSLARVSSLSFARMELATTFQLDGTTAVCRLAGSGEAPSVAGHATVHTRGTPKRTPATPVNCREHHRRRTRKPTPSSTRTRCERHREHELAPNPCQGSARPRREQINAARIGGAQPLPDGRTRLVEYDPTWPELFKREAARIRGVLGQTVRLLEHVGSTSVAGLMARPIIEILLGVPDSSDESEYVPPLEHAGYVLRIREPDWFEHRLFKGPDTDVNLHVFSEGCADLR